jgi:hypothetical protein
VKQRNVVAVLERRIAGFEQSQKDLRGDKRQSGYNKPGSQKRR